MVNDVILGQAVHIRGMSVCYVIGGAHDYIYAGCVGDSEQS